MRGKCILSFAGAVLLTAAPVQARQQLDELIAKNIKARGGLERLQKVNTMRTTGKIAQDGLDIVVVQENKRPGKIRSEFTIQGMTGFQAYDGSTGWQVMPFGGRRDPEVLSGDDMKSLVESADIDGPLVDWRAKGHKVEYLGLEPVDGTDAHKSASCSPTAIRRRSFSTRMPSSRSGSRTSGRSAARASRHRRTSGTTKRSKD